MDHTNDPERTENRVKEVRPQQGGFDVTQDSGWCFWLSDEYGITPKPGDKVTLFGKGIGWAFRGVLINDQVAFYRTEEEQKAWADVQMYGADAADWLQRWDDDRGVWTLHLGGLSAGYDQAINIASAEMLRALLKLKPEFATGEPISRAVRDQIDAEIGNVPSLLGLSGASYMAALRIAVGIYHLGPVQYVGGAPSDSRIQARKRMPSLTPNLDQSAGTLLAALCGLLAIVDQMDKSPSAGGGVLPVDKALATRNARAAIEAARDA